jgi:hypothetical protein
MTMTCTPKRAALLLAAVASALILASAVRLVLLYGFGRDHLIGLAAMVDLGEERNLPTLYSTMLLAICGGALFLVSAAEAKGGRKQWQWTLLGLIFLFLAADEFTGIHERFMLPTRAVFNAGGLFYFTWIIPYGVLVLVLGAIFLRFVLRLPEPTRRLTILAGVVYVTAALGLEAVGGMIYERLGNRPTLGYELLVMAEESIEMFGVILFLHALLDHLARRWPEFAIRFAETESR